jgi:nicotinamide riboside transporter PnuC
VAPESKTSKGKNNKDEAREFIKNLIAERAIIAKQAGKTELFYELVKQSQALNEPSNDITSQREKRLDWARLIVAGLLILGLIGAIYYAMHENALHVVSATASAAAAASAAAQGQTTAQYLSLISGLAGIAIGWLYGNSSTSRRNKQKDEGTK